MMRADPLRSPVHQNESVPEVLAYPIRNPPAAFAAGGLPSNAVLVFYIMGFPSGSMPHPDKIPAHHRYISGRFPL